MRYPTHLFAVLLSILLCTTSLLAQSPEEWVHYSNTTTPTCMIEDGHYLWIGSDGGLVRFDRTVDTFEVFYPENSSLPYLTVTCLTRDTRGRIWAGTLNGGVAVYDHGSWNVFNTLNSALTTDIIAGLAADSIGRVWVASNDGLVKIDDKGSTRYSVTNSPLQNNSIYSVAADQTGNIWISTRNSGSQAELFKFDGQTGWEVHGQSTDNGYYGAQAHSMLVSRDGSLWLGNEGYLCHLIGRNWTMVEAQPVYNGPIYNYVFALQEDTSGAIWASTGYGAGRWDGTKWSTFDKYAKSNFPFVRCRGIVYDTSEMWFAGYEDGGIARWKDSAWTVFDSLSLSAIGRRTGGITTISAMTHDTRGRFWFGNRAQAGLYMFDGTRWSDYTKILQGSAVMALCADSVGNVWIGVGPNGGSSGLVKFDGVTPVYFDLETLANHSNVVSALAYDKRGIVWIGTQWHGNTGYPSGVLRYDGSTWTSYNSKDRTLPWGEVNSLLVNDNGDLWVGLWYKGIGRFDGTNWTFFNPSNSGLPSDQTFGLTLASSGDVWAATGTGGARFDGATWTPYTTANSGILDGLSGVGSDSYGNIWFTAFSAAGVGGVCRFDGTTWRSFSPENSNIGARLMESAMRGVDGEMWFGTYDVGVVRYIPPRSPLRGPSRQTLNVACSFEPVVFTLTLTNASSTPYRLRSIDVEAPEIVTAFTSLPTDFAPGETKSLQLQLQGLPATGRPIVLHLDRGSAMESWDTIDINVQHVMAQGGIATLSPSDSVHPQFEVHSRSAFDDFHARTVIIHLRSTNTDVISIDPSSIAIDPGVRSVAVQTIQPEDGGFTVTATSSEPIATTADQPFVTFSSSRFVTASDSAYLTASFELPGLECAEWNVDSVNAQRLAGCGSSVLSHYLSQGDLFSNVSVIDRHGDAVAHIEAAQSTGVNYQLYDVTGNQVTAGFEALVKGRTALMLAHSLRSGVYIARFVSDSGDVRSARVAIRR